MCLQIDPAFVAGLEVGSDVRFVTGVLDEGAETSCLSQ